MKWIKTRKDYLNEAKVRDVLLPPQIKAVKSTWGEKWLDMEALEPEDVTQNIKQGSWKLSEKDKFKVLDTFFLCELEKIMDVYKSLPEHFCQVLMKSVDENFLKQVSLNWSSSSIGGSIPSRLVEVMENFNPSAPTINQVLVLQEPILRKLSVSESKADEIILRDENGRPIMDENGRPTKRKREEGEVIFSKNPCNINSFLEDYNAIFPNESLSVGIFTQNGVVHLMNLFKENPSQQDYKVEYDVINKDMFLRINHNAKDILNMSISKFYTSCQQLYSGSHNTQLLANIFDPNTIPAFLVFDTPILTKSDEMISEQLPVARMLIRNIIDFDNPEKQTLFFDRGYPDKMREIIIEMVEKYSKNLGTTDSTELKSYIFSPDIPLGEEDLRQPYMDTRTSGLSMEKKPYIGVNTKKLFLKSDSDWTKCIISPKAKIEELIIETPNLPPNFFNMNFNLNWIKFLYLTINTMENFKNIKTDSLAFERCKLENPSNLMSEIQRLFGDVKKLQFTTCKLEGPNVDSSGSNMDFSIFENLEELHLVYTFDSDEIAQIIEQLPKVGEGTKRRMKSLKKLVVSGDVFTENKQLINEFKGKGLKVEIVGPVA